jgi:hypothetical protein
VDETINVNDFLPPDPDADAFKDAYNALFSFQRALNSLETARLVLTILADKVDPSAEADRADAFAQERSLREAIPEAHAKLMRLAGHPGPRVPIPVLKAWDQAELGRRSSPKPPLLGQPMEATADFPAHVRPFSGQPAIATVCLGRLSGFPMAR